MIRAHFGRRFGFAIADHFVEHGIIAREHLLQAVEVGAVTDVDHGDQRDLHLIAGARIGFRRGIDVALDPAGLDEADELLGQLAWLGGLVARGRRSRGRRKSQERQRHPDQVSVVAGARGILPGSHLEFDQGVGS